MTSNSVFLTVTDLANYIKVSKSLIYAWASSGQLKAIYLPHARESKANSKNKSAIRFRLDDVENFIHSLSGMDAGR